MAGGRAIAGVLGVCMALSGVAAEAATNGKIAFQIPRAGGSSLSTINPDGTGLAPLPGLPPDSANVAWNADGTRLAFTSTVTGRTQIYVINADGTGLRQLTTDPVAALDPTWSPDGSQIAYTSWRNGPSNIYVVPDGGGAPRQLTSGQAGDQQPRWSPSGSLIAFASARTGTRQIWAMAPDGSNQRALTSQAGSSADPAWSPDSTQVAYSNGGNIYAVSLAGGAPRVLTADSGTDQFPAWSPDGTQLAFTRSGGLWREPLKGAPFGVVPTLLASFGLDPVWAPLPPPTVARSVGNVTVTSPGSSAAVPISSASTLPTGTTVNALAGGVQVEFKLQAAPAGVPPSTAVVRGAVFTIVKRTPSLLSLSLRPPACGSARAAARRQSSHRGTVRVTRGHYRVLTGQIIAASHLTAYVVTDTCAGTRVTVTAGLVLVTPRHGHRRTVPVAAGHTYFAPARGH